MTESRQLADFGVLSLLIGLQPTLRGALNIIVHYRHLLNEALAIHLEELDKVVVIRQEVVLKASSRQANELALGTLFRLCRALLGPNWRPLGVHFTHAAPPDLQVHRRLFGCPLEFGDEFNGIVCLATDLDAPNAAGDPGLAGHAQRLANTLPPLNAPAIRREVWNAVYLMLPMRKVTPTAVAQGLGLSARALQRDLDAAGTSFEEIVNDARLDLAQRFVGNPDIALVRVAGLLGYQSASAFTRWFTAQFGVAPSVWRRALGRQTSS